MKIIALTGKKGHGKTTAAEYIESKLKNQKVLRIGFKTVMIERMKEELKDTLEQLSQLYQMSVETLFNVKPPVMRALMQNYGTEIYRSKNDGYWVDCFSELLNDVSKDYDVVLVDDMRFKNEYLFLKYNNADIYKIVRKDYEDVVSTSHISEHDLNDVDFNIIEATTREELLEKIDKSIIL